MRKCLEVVVSVDVGALLHSNLAENLNKNNKKININPLDYMFSFESIALFPIYLHADDTVNKEDETNEDGNPWQSLEGFDESPE